MKVFAVVLLFSLSSASVQALPTTSVSGSPPPAGEDDQRCGLICERLDYCDKLVSSTLPSTSACVVHCNTWGSSFLTKEAKCSFEESSSCSSLVADCWVPTQHEECAPQLCPSWNCGEWCTCFDTNLLYPLCLDDGSPCDCENYPAPGPAVVVDPPPPVVEPTPINPPFFSAEGDVYVYTSESTCTRKTNIDPQSGEKTQCCGSASTIVVDESVTEIAPYAFYGETMPARGLPPDARALLLTHTRTLTSPPPMMHRVRLL